MNTACTHTIDDPFPEPRRFAMEDRSARALGSLSRHVYLSRVAQRRQPPLSRRLAAVGAGLAAALLVLAALNVFVFPNLGLPEPPAAVPAGADEPQSTPRHLWARGAAPFLYQTDPAWADAPYGGGTVATHGCGPTCLAMAYVQLTGKADRDPAAMAAFSEQAGYVDPAAGITSWTLMSEGAAQLGLASQELSPSADAVRAELRRGRPVICSLGPGDFTADGHFILLTGVDDQGRFIIRDPNSPERSQQAWDPARIFSQCLNLWSFTAA